MLARLSALPWVDSPGNEKIAQIHSPSSSSSSRLWAFGSSGDLPRKFWRRSNISSRNGAPLNPDKVTDNSSRFNSKMFRVGQGFIGFSPSDLVWPLLLLWPEGSLR